MSYRMTPYLEKIIRKAEKNYAAGKNIPPVFSTTKEMLEWLNTPMSKNRKRFITTHAKAVKNLDI